ncbi:MAG TPA: hypothetical protein VKV16_06250 [Solirubrobacteraceae bacterium]|nr:hypothetical protein [Solirubrobacteraceae bacterium]
MSRRWVEHLYGGTLQNSNGETLVTNFFGSQEDGFNWTFKVDAKVQITRHFFTGDAKHDFDSYFVTKPDIAWDSATGSGFVTQNQTEGCDPTLYPGDKT